VLQFDTSIWGCEVPVCLGVVGIAVALPSGDFLDEGLFVRNPTIEANASHQLRCSWGRNMQARQNFYFSRLLTAI
jgi:hypothetical protein